MAYARPRSNGKFTAYYNKPDGQQVSAGTFDSESIALRVAEETEVFHRTGRKGLDPAAKATMTISEYGPRWVASHRVEPSTRTNYRALLSAHVYPQFGDVRVAELQREQVRGYITTLIEAGKSVSLQRSVRAVLSAMMQTAWDDEYRQDNPVRGLRVQRGSHKPIVVMKPEQFGEVYRALPSDGARALANTRVKTGCRFGEAVVLLVSDFNFDRQVLSFTKGLQEVGRANHPDGTSRFYVAPYTKTHDQRAVKIDKKLAVQIQNWIVGNDLGPDDLLFPRSLLIPRRRQQRERVELTAELLATLGTVTAPNGREYQHGTWNAYITAKCRCEHCGQAFAEYRYDKDRSKRHSTDPSGATDRHYDTSDFVDKSRWGKVWKGACQDAGLSFMPTQNQLRHTHASWLINNGEDPKTVMDRIGHKDLSTTTRYVHAVDPDDESAADIMESLGDWD